MPNINQRLNGLTPLSYLGDNAVQPPDFITKNRPPNATDSKNVYLGTIWLNTAGYPGTLPTNEDVWMLVALVGNQATWVNFGGGDLETLTGNTGGPVSPDGAGNINIVGDGVTVTVVGNPGTNTLTISYIGATGATSFPTDAGTATPALGVLNIIANQAGLGSGSSVFFSAPGAANTVQLNVTDALSNTLVGNLAGNLTLTASNSVGLGNNVLHALTSGNANTVVGSLSGALITTGANNVILGKSAAASLVSGSGNIIIGESSGANLVAAESNNLLIADDGVAGVDGLIVVSIPNEGDFIHNYPGVPASVNGYNCFLGLDAGNFTMNVSAIGNTGIGALAIGSLTTGTGNTCIGNGVAFRITSGTGNVCLGDTAGQNPGGGTGLTTGSNNTLIGSQAGNSYTGAESNNILIGSGVSGVTGESNVCRIAQIRGVTTNVNDAIAVLIDSTGQLGTVSSSRRVKDNIHDMGHYSECLYRLRPVTFNYNNRSSECISVGLIAEEVYETAPQLVAHSSDGEIETVKYQDLVPMLLNEIQKLQKRISILESQLL